MAIVTLRVIRKTIEPSDSERILEETAWRQLKVFGISLLNKKVHYRCTLVEKNQKIGFKTK